MAANCSEWYQSTWKSAYGIVEKTTTNGGEDEEQFKLLLSHCLRYQSTHMIAICVRPGDADGWGVTTNNKKKRKKQNGDSWRRGRHVMNEWRYYKICKLTFQSHNWTSTWRFLQLSFCTAQKSRLHLYSSASEEASLYAADGRQVDELRILNFHQTRSSPLHIFLSTLSFWACVRCWLMALTGVLAGNDKKVSFSFCLLTSYFCCLDIRTKGKHTRMMIKLELTKKVLSVCRRHQHTIYSLKFCLWQAAKNYSRHTENKNQKLNSFAASLALPLLCLISNFKSNNKFTSLTTTTRLSVVCCDSAELYPSAFFLLFTQHHDSDSDLDDCLCMTIAFVKCQVVQDGSGWASERKFIPTMAKNSLNCMQLFTKHA